MGLDQVAILLMQVPEVRWDECRPIVVLQILVLFHSLSQMLDSSIWLISHIVTTLFKIIFTKARAQMSYSVGERCKTIIWIGRKL